MSYDVMCRRSLFAKRSSVQIPRYQLPYERSEEVFVTAMTTFQIHLPFRCMNNG